MLVVDHRLSFAAHHLQPRQVQALDGEEVALQLRDMQHPLQGEVPTILGGQLAGPRAHRLDVAPRLRRGNPGGNWQRAVAHELAVVRHKVVGGPRVQELTVLTVLTVSLA
jgi:hypothetical protein